MLPRTGIGTDVHAFAPEDSDRPLHVACLEWPGEVGLEGHSDGDVAAHAACDALLSAAGLGDIGSMFGTDDPRFAGARGSVFLEAAVERLRAQGHSVSSAHLRHLNPFPRNLGEVVKSFERVIVPEMNLGQLCTLIRAKYLVDAVAFSKVKGRPFQIREIMRKVEEYL